jgi:hypothetical protein
MRDMFGEVPEPWLVSGRISQPLPQKEQTISNTNASGSDARRPPELAHEQAPMHLPPETAGGELASRHDEAPSASDRSASAYAPMSPGYGQSPVLPMPAYPVPSMSPLANQAMNQPMGGSSLPGRSALAGGSQLLPYGGVLPPFGAQAVPSQTPGLLPLGVQHIARTRQGYTGAPGASQSEVSQQRYEAPYDGALNVSLSNHRVLYIGLGTVLVGIIVLLAIAIFSDDAAPASPSSTPTATERKGEPAAVESSAAKSTPATKPEGAPAKTLTPEPVPPEAFRPEGATRQGAAVPKPATVDVISVHVLSTPRGAEVLLAGKSLGVTPLTVEIPRATGIVPLTVRHPKFGDNTTKVDLSSDISAEVTLAAAPEPARPSVKERPDRADRGERGDRSRPNRGEKAPARDSKNAPTSGAQQCQRPDRYNPFDTSCGGQPCPACESETPKAP